MPYLLAQGWGSSPESPKLGKKFTFPSNETCQTLNIQPFLQFNIDTSASAPETLGKRGNSLWRRCEGIVIELQEGQAAAGAIEQRNLGDGRLNRGGAGGIAGLVEDAFPNVLLLANEILCKYKFRRGLGRR